ncbi:MAG: hypothetical protein JST80_04715 [Bdellovibrionales bacterium]|nr:hypothetical protein [Bdellovibrionales bacterium]
MNILTLSVLLLTALASPSAFSQGFQFDSDISEDLKTQVNSDLASLKAIHLVNSSVLNDSVFGKNHDYTTWLLDRVQKFGFGKSDRTAVAYFQSISAGKIWVTKNYIKYPLPMIYRVSTFLHEARHTEDEFNYHADCPKPYKLSNGEPVLSYYSKRPLAGDDACDDSAVGAYGIEGIFYRNIVRYCDNCTDKVKADAEIQFEESLKRVSNKAEHHRLMDDSDFHDELIDFSDQSF